MGLDPPGRSRSTPMPRMTAAAAAVEILKREGVTTAFGVPGAAINPFYRELKNVGGIGHTLARHVEGASHMAEGYTRAKAGNIGVCIGTSGPMRHRHDHRSVLGDRGLDPDPVHHRPGPGLEAPQGGLPGRRHRLDRQAGDQGRHDRPGGRAGPRRLPAGLPPDALRPPRPGPHRPPDRRPADRDRVRPGDLRAAGGLQAAGHPRPGREGTELPPGVRAPADRRRWRHHQRRRVRPPRRVRRADQRPGHLHSDGLGHHPGRPRAGGRHGRCPDRAPLRQRDLPGVGLRPRHRQPLGQPSHRLQHGRVHQGPEVRPRRHRAHPDRQDLRSGLRHRLRRQGRAGALHRDRQGAEGHAASCRTSPPGPPPRRSARPPSSAGRTSTTSRSSRSASTRR